MNKEGEQKIQNQLGIFYNSKDLSFKYCNENELSINVLGEVFIDTSTADFYNEDRLTQCIDRFAERLWVTEETLTNEMCNPENDGYIGREKAQIMLSDKVQKISNVNLMPEYKDSSDYYDDQPIKAMMPFCDTLLTRDYGQAARAYHNNESFFFPLGQEQINNINKIGREKFKLKFIREIKIKEKNIYEQ